MSSSFSDDSEKLPFVGCFEVQLLWQSNWSSGRQGTALYAVWRFSTIGLNGFDRSTIGSELLERIEGEWDADDSHLMNGIFGGVAQLSGEPTAWRGCGSTGKLCGSMIGCPKGGLINTNQFAGMLQALRTLDSSVGDEDTAILGLWGDLWHGIFHACTDRRGPGRCRAVQIEETMLQRSTTRPCTVRECLCSLLTYPTVQVVLRMDRAGGRCRHAEKASLGDVECGLSM